MLDREVRESGVPGIRDAETLVRSLVGVAAVAIQAGPDGRPAGITVQSDGTTSDRQLSRNVFSALKARFALDIDPAAITISRAKADTSTHIHPSAATPLNGQAARVSAAQNGHHASRVANGAANAAAGDVANGNGVKRNGSGPMSPHANGTSELPTAAAHAHVSADADARIHAVDFSNVGANRRCTVVVAAADQRFIGIAESADSQNSDMDLVGRAAIDALRAARSIPDALMFAGATVTDVGGRPHVIVSIARGNGHDFDFIAGAEPIRATAAEAAARAVVGSLNVWQH